MPPAPPWTLAELVTLMSVAPSPLLTAEMPYPAVPVTAPPVAVTVRLLTD